MPDNVLGVLFQDIANAIRAKTGGTDTMKPAEFPLEIANIPVGGGSVEGVHFVTFKNEDGTKELYKRPVADGDNCADIVARGLIDKPTKEMTDAEVYTYSGWSMTSGGAADSAALQNVTEDRTVYAAFTATARKYTARFYDDSGALMQESQVAYGTKATPPDTAKDGLIFSYWTPNDLTIYGDTDFYGTWITAIYTLMANPESLSSKVSGGVIHPISGHLILSEGSYGEVLGVYDISSETPTQLFSVNTNQQSSNGALAFSPDGTRLAKTGTTYSNYCIQVFDTTTTPYTLIGTTSLSYYPRALIYSTDGSKLLVGLDTTKFITLDATQVPYVTTDNILSWSASTYPSYFAYNSDKTILGLGSGKGAYFYDTTTTPYTLITSMNINTTCDNLAFSPNGNEVAITIVITTSGTNGYQMGELYSINSETKKFTKAQTFYNSVSWSRMRWAYHPDGNRLVGMNNVDGEAFAYNANVVPYTSAGDLFDAVPDGSIANIFYNNDGSRLIAIGEYSSLPLYIYNTEVDMVSK